MESLLDVVGLLLLAAFVVLIWWPLALAVAGVGCLWVSWNRQRRRTSRGKETAR